MGRRRNKRENVNEIHIPSAPPPPPPPWIELPEDVTANILQRLGAEEILESAQKVCSTWWKLCKDPSMWRKIALERRYSNYRTFNNTDYVLLCRAVDRSQGQMAELSIAHFGDNELLNYVALRCSNLRGLVLEGSRDISPLALTDAVQKLPQLEGLHLIKSFYLEAEDAETIGLSCPLLKSFTYDAKLIILDNPVALAVAKTMPNLHNLRLLGVVMKNEGLKAILDGCPCLELLDIRDCYCLDLKDARALGERCSKQIKDLRLPNDSHDYYDDDFDYRDYYD